jgi:hypothetical protein
MKLFTQIKTGQMGPITILENFYSNGCDGIIGYPYLMFTQMDFSNVIYAFLGTNSTDFTVSETLVIFVMVILPKCRYVPLVCRLIFFYICLNILLSFVL